MFIIYFGIVITTLVEFRPIMSKQLTLSLYNHFEHEQPVFKFVSDLHSKNLQGYNTKAMIYKLQNNEYSIQFDNMKMCYDQEHNSVFACDVYWRCKHTNWRLQIMYDNDKVQIINNGNCITYKSDKQLTMEPCVASNISQIFLVVKKKLKLHCRYDENHSDELELEI